MNIPRRAVAGGWAWVRCLGLSPLLLAGCDGQPAHRMDLNLGGPAGLAVNVGILADGQTQAFRAMIPTNLTWKARDLSYRVEAVSNLAGLRTTLYVDELPRQSTLAGTNGGVFGRCRIMPAETSSSAAGF